MQFNVGSLCFVLVGTMAAATAAFRLDMEKLDGLDSLALRDAFAIGMSSGMGSDFGLNADPTEKSEDSEGKGKGKGRGKKGRAKKGQGARGKGQGKAKGKGQDKGKEGGGEAAQLD